MSTVLDTSVLSALMRGEEAPAARLLEADPRTVSVPQPVLAEIEYGLARLRASKRRQLLDDRFRLLAGSLNRAPWTDDVSREFGRVKAKLESVGRRLDDFDVAIAAHALASGGPVATRNVRHFSRVPGLTVEEW